jgi:hypothetical protein
MPMTMTFLRRAAQGVACVALAADCNHSSSAPTHDTGTATPDAGTSASASPAASNGENPASAPAMAVESLHGRGVFYAEAATRCPSFGIGSRSDHACLRIGLDDEHSSADIDRANHRIVLSNDGVYVAEQIVADVVLPGWSESAKGRTPIAVHCVVRKKAKTFSTKVYSHVVSREKPTKVEIEDLQIVWKDGTNETVLVNAESAQKVVADPGVAARLAGFMTEVSDNLAGGAAPSDAGEPGPIGDITVSIGVGTAAKKALRAQLFRKGADTEVRLTALSSLIPAYIVQRDLFLYGLEPAENLGDVKKRGFKAGDTLVMVVHDHEGSVRFGQTSADLPGAANSARDFLTTAFVGMVLAHQAHLDSH